LYWGIASNGSQQYHTSYLPGSARWNADRYPAAHSGFVVFFYPNVGGFWATKVINGVPSLQNEYLQGNPEASLPLAGNNTLVIGLRQGTGWLCILDSNLAIVEEYVYNNTNRFYGIASYDANTWAVIDDGHNSGAAARLLLLNKTDYSVVNAYSLPAVGNAGVRTMLPAVNGIIRMAKRDNTYVEINVPNNEGSVRRYESQWIIGGLTAEEEGGTVTQRPAINITHNRVITYHRAIQQTTRTDMEFNRLLFTSFGLYIPAGSYTLSVQPPYTDSNVELTVTQTPVTLTSVSPFPSRTSATNVTTSTVTMGVSAPAYLAPFTEAEELDFSLEIAAICPPAISASISGSATAVQSVGQTYTAAVTPDPSLSTWTHTYAWSSTGATFSNNSIINPLITWTSTGSRTLSLIVTNPGYSVTTTLNVEVNAPPPPARYWRFAGIAITGTLLEISELQLFSAATLQTGTITASDIPTFALTNLTDASTSTRCFWTAAVATAGGFWIQLDLGTDVNITGVKIGSWDDSSRYPTAFRLESSPNGTTWTTITTKSGLVYPGGNALSALIAIP
jgi:hypothetical protein